MHTKNLELLFEEHKGLINSVIWKNHPLLFALRLDLEDIAQELSIIMLKAITRFDPNRSASLAAHIRCSLQYEILNIKRRYKPHGITGVPKDSRLNFLYLDCAPSSEDAYELPSYDDASSLEFSELLNGLSALEAEAVELNIQGYPIRRKSHIHALDNVRHRYAELYSDIGEFVYA